MEQPQSALLGRFTIDKVAEAGERPLTILTRDPRRGAIVKPINVGAVLRACSYGLKYLIGHQLFGKTIPLIRGLVLANRCNLRCRHCRLDARGPMDLNFAKVVAAIDAFHREGGRCLYLEGGEPFLWHDGQQGLDDVVGYAHGLGFLTAVVVYTNGTLPICTSADTVFVSIDGLRDTHDALRGKSFDRIMGNMRDSAHASLYVNYTINNRNKDEIREFNNDGFVLGFVASRAVKMRQMGRACCTIGDRQRFRNKSGSFDL